MGKSTLCSLLKSHTSKPPLFLDIGTGTKFLDVARIDDIDSWQDLRAALHNADIWSSYGAVILDDMTKAEELAARWVIENVKNDKGLSVSSVEGFGFGKGLTHVYEAFLPLLGDLDAHVRQGRQVVCIAHECTANVPNPAGEDWIRFEPRLQSPASGKSSIRHRVKEWCDHLLFVGFDTFVTNEGKAQGSGTRTIYPTELPTHWAKSRCLASPIPYEEGSGEIWKQLLSGGK